MSELREMMLDVLIYIFQHFMDKATGTLVKQVNLSAELERAGFRADEAMIATGVLESLGQTFQTSMRQQQSAGGQALRVYTLPEMQKIDIAGRGFLLFLDSLGVMSASHREWVIEQAMQLSVDTVTLEHLKWLILMVLLNNSAESTFSIVPQNITQYSLTTVDSVH